MLSVIRGYMQVKLGQRGAEMVEYAIVIACIAAVGVAVYGMGTNGTTGGALNNIIEHLFGDAEKTVTGSNSQP